MGKIPNGFKVDDQIKINTETYEARSSWGRTILGVFALHIRIGKG